MRSFRVTLQPHDASAQFRRWQPLLDGLVLLLIASAVRFAWLDRNSLWSDEIFSVLWSQLDPAFLQGAGQHLETNPPPYYLLLHLWMQALGTDAVAVRSLSGLCSVATVVVTYAIGFRLFGRSGALLAAIFLVIDPSSVYFGQTARPYALLSLLQAIALLALCSALDSASDRPGRILWIAVFSTAAAAAFRVHYTALFFICACFLAAAVHLRLSGSFSRRLILPWIGSACFVGIAIAGPLVIAVSMSHSADIYWIEELNLRQVARFTALLIGYPGIGDRFVLIGAAGAILILVVATGMLRRPPNLLQLETLVLVPGAYCVFLIAVSVVRPLLAARYGQWLSVPFCLMLAYATQAQPWKWPRLIATSAVLSVLLFFTAHYFIMRPNEDWRAAAQFIASNPKCQGPLVSYGPHNVSVQYYAPQIAGRPMYWVRPVRHMPETAESFLNDMITHSVPLEREDLAPFIHANPGAVLVMRRGWLGDSLSLLGVVADELRDKATMHGELTIFCH